MLKNLQSRALNWLEFVNEMQCCSQAEVMGLAPYRYASLTISSILAFDHHYFLIDKKTVQIIELTDNVGLFPNNLNSLVHSLFIIQQGSIQLFHPSENFLTKLFDISNVEFVGVDCLLGGSEYCVVSKKV